MNSYHVRFNGSEQIADGTRAFHFDKPEGFSFQAGQALTLILPLPTDDGPQPARHTFSIVSAPHDNDLTIATRMRDSPFKQALGALPVGAEVELKGPFGKLTLQGDQSHPAIMLAGGIGITPFVSMLRQAARESLAQRFVLLYSNRRPEDAAFLAELQALEKQRLSLQLIATMTQLNLSTQPWSGPTGQIDGALLARVATGQLEPIYYLAGPLRFVEAMQELLNEMGVEDDSIRSEGFYGY